jgi:predicted Rossmann fold flavoprotein
VNVDRKDVPRIAVIGGGAAGTMAAIFAAASGAETALFERTADGGRKILISGGGRCNILPSSLDESRFVTDSSIHTLRKIVRSWPLGEQITFFERDAGIPLVEESESAKLFPASQSARDVRDRLYALARARGVSIVTSALVANFSPERDGWRIDLEGREPQHADAVIVASGGLSIPRTGSDGGALQIVARLGHAVHATYPALAPVLADPAPFGALAGVSLPVAIAARSAARSAVAAGGFLFTHGGYSGPAVLDVSHVAVRALMEGQSATLSVRWSTLGDGEWTDRFKPHGSRTVLNAVSDVLPQRLAEALIAHAGVQPRTTLATLTRTDRLRLIESLVRGELPWTGPTPAEGYKKAEVTGGGVSLAEVDPRTMESRRAPRLFLCGEILDAFGPIGGYNFFWAWATGRAAGRAAADAARLQAGARRLL